MVEYILIGILIFWIIYALIIFILWLAGKSEGFMTFNSDVQNPYIDMKFKQNYPTIMYNITPEKYFANNNWYKTTVN